AGGRLRAGRRGGQSGRNRRIAPPRRAEGPAQRSVRRADLRGCPLYGCAQPHGSGRVGAMKTDLSIDLLRANSEAMAGRLKLLAHPERLLMLCRISDEEVTVSELVELTGLAQSAVS